MAEALGPVSEKKEGGWQKRRAGKRLFEVT